MNRIVYVNGAYMPEQEATVSIFDRGFLMADGVYEVTSVLQGKLIDFEGHAQRLKRSLDALDMAMPMPYFIFVANEITFVCCGRFGTWEPTMDGRISRKECTHELFQSRSAETTIISCLGA